MVGTSKGAVKEQQLTMGEGNKRNITEKIRNEIKALVFYL
jgi:hypothetical protein